MPIIISNQINLSSSSAKYKKNSYNSVMIFDLLVMRKNIIYYIIRLV